MRHGLMSLDRAMLAQFVREWEQLFDDGEHRRMAAFYTEDALLVATQRETEVGRPAIEEFWRTACAGARSTGLKRTVHVDAVESSGQLGYVRGIVRLRQAGASDAFRVRYVTVWRRETDGAWRIAVDISSPAPGGSESIASQP